eukprot:m51a1_g1289 putative serine-threonine protein (1284) ;mRNA; r:167200-173541
MKRTKTDAAVDEDAGALQLCDMPDNVLTSVFLWLVSARDVSAVVRLSSACRRLRRLSCDPALWGRADAGLLLDDPPSAERLPRSPHARLCARLSLAFCGDAEQLDDASAVAAAASAGPRLRALVAPAELLEDDSLVAVAQACPGLEELVLKGALCAALPSGVHRALGLLGRLRRLRLPLAPLYEEGPPGSGGATMEQLELPRSLEEVTLASASNSSLEALFRGKGPWENVRSLCIKKAAGTVSSALASVAGACVGLESVAIMLEDGGHDLRYSDITSVWSQCPRLRSFQLEVADWGRYLMPHYDVAGLRDGLRTVRLFNRAATTVCARRVAANFPCLRRLQLCPRCRQLDSSYVRAISSLRLLRSLQLSDTTSQVLSILGDCLFQLRVLVLERVQGDLGPVLRLPFASELRRLSLVECDIHASALEALAANARVLASLLLVPQATDGLAAGLPSVVDSCPLEALWAETDGDGDKLLEGLAPHLWRLRRLYVVAPSVSAEKTRPANPAMELPRPAATVLRSTVLLCAIISCACSRAPSASRDAVDLAMERRHGFTSVRADGTVCTPVSATTGCPFSTQPPAVVGQKMRLGMCCMYDNATSCCPAGGQAWQDTVDIVGNVTSDACCRRNLERFFCSIACSMTASPATYMSSFLQYTTYLHPETAETLYNSCKDVCYLKKIVSANDATEWVTRLHAKASSFWNEIEMNVTLKVGFLDSTGCATRLLQLEESCSASNSKCPCSDGSSTAYCSSEYSESSACCPYGRSFAWWHQEQFSTASPSCLLNTRRLQCACLCSGDSGVSEESVSCRTLFVTFGALPKKRRYGVHIDKATLFDELELLEVKREYSDRLALTNLSAEPVSFLCEASSGPNPKFSLHFSPDSGELPPKGTQEIRATVVLECTTAATFPLELKSGPSYFIDWDDVQMGDQPDNILIFSDSPMAAVVAKLTDMAPEVLLNRPYLIKADVFSFSVVAWEIFSQSPAYADFRVVWDIAKFIAEGQRLKLPEGDGVPPMAGSLIARCWEQDPASRPDSQAVARECGAMHSWALAQKAATGQEHNRNGRELGRTLSETPSGYTAHLVSLIEDGARAAGAQCEVVTLARHKVNRCLGCNKCQFAESVPGPCAFAADDFERVVAAIERADVVVYATPVYIFGMSSLLKAFFERFYGLGDASLPYVSEAGLMFHATHPAIRKPFVSLVVCANPENATPSNALHWFDRLSEFCDAPCVGTLVRNTSNMGFKALQDNRKDNTEFISVPFFWLLKRIRVRFIKQEFMKRSSREAIKHL